MRCQLVAPGGQVLGVAQLLSARISPLTLDNTRFHLGRASKLPRKAALRKSRIGPSPVAADDCTRTDGGCDPESVPCRQTGVGGLGVLVGWWISGSVLS